MTLTFRCAPELVSVLPPPFPAVEGLPDWFKALPQKSYNAIAQEDSQTVKRCPPFIDAMTYGYLMPLPCDLKVENGEFSWDSDLPVNIGNTLMRSPISFHDPSQVIGTPYHHDDRFIIKFNNFWTIQIAARVLAAVYTSGEPAGVAVHHPDRPGRHRRLSRCADPFSRTLAQRQFHGCPEKGNAGGAMHPRQA